MKFVWGGRWLPMALTSLALGATAQTGPVNGIYTCVDGQGRRLNSDRPIPECLDREQKLLNPSGTVARKLGPSLTAAERAQLEAKERQEALEHERMLEERRRERALLARYPSRAVHDRERASAIEQVMAASQAARVRMGELATQRKMLEDEMEFYRKDPSKAPQYLRRQVEENSRSTDEQRRFLIGQEDELKRINSRFDGELQILQPLWAAAGSP